MSTRKADRNADIVRRREEGQTFPEIAAAIGITAHRARNIYVNENGGPQALAQTALARAHADGFTVELENTGKVWTCIGHGISGKATTPTGAYGRWKQAHARRNAAQARQAQRRSAPPDAPLQVVPPRRPHPHTQLTLSNALRLNGARAAACQPPIKSIASSIPGNTDLGESLPYLDK